MIIERQDIDSLSPKTKVGVVSCIPGLCKTQADFLNFVFFFLENGGK